MCQHCTKSLKKSFAINLPNSKKAYKTCPSCSVQAGYHVFYPAPDLFGCSVARVNSRNKQGIQSHCKYCRSHRLVPGSVERLSCKDFL